MLGRNREHFLNARQPVPFEFYARVHRKFAQRTHLVLRIHDYRRARAACAAGAPSAMHVAFGIKRHAELHDKVDASDIEPTRSNICRHKHLKAAGAELRQRRLALALRDVAVQHCRTALQHARRRKLVRLALRLRKHDCAPRAEAATVHSDNVVQERCARLKVARCEHRAVAHCRRSHRHALTNRIKHHGIALMLARNVLHPRRHCRRKQNRLPRLLRRQRVEHLVHVLGKTHRKHLVRLVQHKEAHSTAVDVVALQVVDEAPRRRHQKVDTALQRALLHVVARAAVEALCLKPVRLRQRVNFARNLQRKLAGRSENNAARASSAAGSHPMLVFLRTFHRDQPFENRYGKRERLAGARARARDDVAAVVQVVVRSVLHVRHSLNALLMQQLHRQRRDSVRAEFVRHVAFLHTSRRLGLRLELLLVQLFAFILTRELLVKLFVELLLVQLLLVKARLFAFRAARPTGHCGASARVDLGHCKQRGERARVPPAAPHRRRGRERLHRLHRRSCRRIAA
mmetsp:Transcript_2629/g.7157  ORF Transcript_2629/g.7157 Transcript_2629/m.7157 type:complete len:515 (+) Transcript_2629:722-2266(+)